MRLISGHRLLITLSLLFSLFAWPAQAQWNNDAQKCSIDTTSYKQKIHYCTLAIASGQLSQINLANTYFNRGVAFDSHGEFENALGDFSDAIKLNPEDPDYYLNRAIVYLDLGSADLALADFDQAALLAPTDPRVFYNRGLIRENTGDMAGAKEDYLRSYALAPEDPDVVEKMTQLGLKP